MHRARPAWSVLLLALLLGISPRADAPVDARAGAAILRPAAGAGSPDAYYVRAAASLSHALAWRPPTDRQHSTLGGTLQSRLAVPLLVDPQPCARASRDAVRPPGEARRFPRFPTGPPSHI
jgi:hypothetical protein